MPTPSTLNGVLVQWGDRLFYPVNRVVRARTPKLSEAVIPERALAIRQRIHAIVVRHAPQVMVKVTGRRARHGGDRSAPALHQQERPAADRGRPRP